VVVNAIADKKVGPRRRPNAGAFREKKSLSNTTHPKKRANGREMGRKKVQTVVPDLPKERRTLRRRLKRKSGYGARNNRLRTVRKSSKGGGWGKAGTLGAREEGEGGDGAMAGKGGRELEKKNLSSNWKGVPLKGR